MNGQLNNEQDIFHAALQLAPEDRSAYLSKACGMDEALRDRVAALLEAAAKADPFFGRGPLGVVLGEQQSQPAVVQPLSEKPGDRIGRYKLLEQIGEGGMGVVYLAEQEEPVRRKVALKIIKLGMDTKQVIARFEAERQAWRSWTIPISRRSSTLERRTPAAFFVMESGPRGAHHRILR